MLRFHLITILTFGFFSAAHAQNVQVQQPLVQQFSVDTTVVVPDRGTAFLGGVSNAATSVPTYGPLPYGTAFGSEVSSSHAETSVFIHDFELMDRLILQEGQRRFSQYFSSPGNNTISSDPRVRYVLKNRKGNSQTSQERVAKKRLNSKNLNRQKALLILKHRR